ncbi:MAG: hypothetical protein K2I05_09300 [Mailhella sp.]|nr:hypothetical protein [Mailhella sp.]
MTNLIQEIAYIEKDGQFLFSAEEIGKQLGYAEPAKFHVKFCLTFRLF